MVAAVTDEKPLLLGSARFGAQHFNFQQELEVPLCCSLPPHAHLHGAEFSVSMALLCPAGLAVQRCVSADTVPDLPACCAFSMKFLAFHDLKNASVFRIVAKYIPQLDVYLLSSLADFFPLQSRSEILEYFILLEHFRLSLVSLALMNCYELDLRP